MAKRKVTKLPTPTPAAPAKPTLANYEADYQKLIQAINETQARLQNLQQAALRCEGAIAALRADAGIESTVEG